jgi:hypothetical protein
VREIFAPVNPILMLDVEDQSLVKNADEVEWEVSVDGRQPPIVSVDFAK